MKLSSRALHESNFYTYPNTNEDPKFIRLRTTACTPHLCTQLYPRTRPHPCTLYLCTCLHPCTCLHQLTLYLCTLLHPHPHPTTVHAPVPTNPTPVHMPAPTVHTHFHMHSSSRPLGQFHLTEGIRRRNAKGIFLARITNSTKIKSKVAVFSELNIHNSKEPSRLPNAHDPLV